MKIILDTNFLMSIVQFKIDIFDQLKGHELFVIEPVMVELNKLSLGQSKDSKAAKIALGFIKTKGLKVLKSKEKSADRSLILYSKDYAIATQDRLLKKNLKEAGAKVIYIRQRKYVVI